MSQYDLHSIQYGLHIVSLYRALHYLYFNRERE